MTEQPPADADQPIDVAAVADDDQLVEDLRAGAEPPTSDQVAATLAAWRDQTNAPPIFEQVAGRHPGIDIAEHPVHDPATTMLPAALDLQGWAYRGMTDGDIVTDDQLVRYVADVHLPLPGDPAGRLRSPEDYEREQWDAEREDPR